MSSVKKIVIGSIDHIDKEGQSKLLAEYLKNQGKKTHLQSFPNMESLSSGPARMYWNGELSEKVDEIDGYQASALFAIDRFCTVKKLFKEEKPEYAVFVCYVEGNMLFQGGKMADRDSFYKYIDWLYDFEYEKLKIPQPDVTIYLDMDEKLYSEIVDQKLKEVKGNIESGNKECLMRALGNGKRLAQKFKWNVINCQNEKGELKTSEEIHQDIINELKRIKII